MDLTSFTANKGFQNKLIEMRSKYLVAVPLFLLLTVLSGAIDRPNADCDSYYASKPGTVLDLIEYNHKQQETGRTTYTVKNHSGQTTTIHVLTIDSKGKQLVNTDYTVNCDGNEIVADQKKIVASTVAANMTDPNVSTEVRGENARTPVELAVGQELPGNEIDIDVKSSGINMTVKVKTTNRKVAGQETITVPAGTFDCIVVTANTESFALVSKKTSTKSWMAKGVGVVKMETYDKKGKLEKVQVLTSVKS
jgi:hypothetical protein